MLLSMHKVHYLAVGIPGAYKNFRVPGCIPDLTVINGNISSASGGEDSTFLIYVCI